MNVFPKYCKDKTHVTIFLPAVVRDYLMGDLNLRHPSRFALRLLHVEVELAELYRLQNQ